MKKENSQTVTTNQMSCMIIGAMIGTGVLFYPNLIIKDARQDGWICPLAGVLYPAYMILIAVYMSRFSPSENVLKLSKRFLGKFIGNVLNILFLAQFIIYSSIKSAQLSNLTRLYINYFLTQRIAILIIVITTVYSTYKGIEVLGRGNEIIYYFTIAMVLVPLGVFTRGNPLNLLPVFKVSPVGLVKGSVTAGLQYFGIEIIFLLYPFMQNKKDLFKAGFKAVAICMIIFTWFEIACIYYLGINIMPKYLWVVVETSKSFRMNTIKNFTFIFMFFWIMIILKNISNLYFSSALILNELWAKLSIKNCIVGLAPFIFYLSLRVGNETLCRNILTILVPIFTIYNIIYVTCIALLIKFRGRISHEIS